MVVILFSSITSVCFAGKGETIMHDDEKSADFKGTDQAKEKNSPDLPKPLPVSQGQMTAQTPPSRNTVTNQSPVQTQPQSLQHPQTETSPQVRTDFSQPDSSQPPMPIARHIAKDVYQPTRTNTDQISFPSPQTDQSPSVQANNVAQGTRIPDKEVKSQPKALIPSVTYPPVQRNFYLQNTIVENRTILLGVALSIFLVGVMMAKPSFERSFEIPYFSLSPDDEGENEQAKPAQPYQAPSFA